eukprot:1262834-Alexandrium_andersonii.AAC.1
MASEESTRIANMDANSISAACRNLNARLHALPEGSPTRAVHVARGAQHVAQMRFHADWWASWPLQ